MEIYFLKICIGLREIYKKSFKSVLEYIVASELKDPIWHSLEWQIGSFSSEATICQLIL